MKANTATNFLNTIKTQTPSDFDTFYQSITNKDKSKPLNHLVEKLQKINLIELKTETVNHLKNKSIQNLNQSAKTLLNGAENKLLLNKNKDVEKFIIQSVNTYIKVLDPLHIRDLLLVYWHAESDISSTLLKMTTYVSALLKGLNIKLPPVSKNDPLDVVKDQELFNKYFKVCVADSNIPKKTQSIISSLFAKIIPRQRFKDVVDFYGSSIAKIHHQLANKLRL